MNDDYKQYKKEDKEESFATWATTPIEKKIK